MKRVILILGILSLLIAFAPKAEAAIVYVAGDDCNASGGSGCTTGMVNASGANFSVCTVSATSVYSPVDADVTDSNMNSYVHLTQTNSIVVGVVIFYSENATMTNGMTFSFAGTTGGYPVLVCMAFSGVKTSSAFNKESAGGSQASSTTVQPGSSTPDNGNALVITGWAGDGAATTLTVNGGFAALSAGINFEDYGTSYAGAGSYLIQTTATAANPTWTSGGTLGPAAVLAVFDASASSCTPDHLTITTPPMSSTFAVGVGMVVAVKDSGGTTCTSDNSTSITLSSHSGSPCSTLASATNLTKTVTSGVATWASADLTTALNGTACTIDASDSGALTDATSSAFNICQQGSGVDYCGVHGHAASANNNSVTVTVTTTGSTALIAYCASGQVTQALSDGDMQTWTALTAYSGTAVDDKIRGFYIENPTVGASKTYTCTATAGFPAICVMGITGTTTSIFRAENGSGTTGAAMTLSPGNVTVTATDIVTSALAVGAVAGSVTIDDSFIIADHQAFVAATNYGLDCGFKTGDSGTVGPAWSWANSVTGSGTNDVFKVGTVTASTSRMTLLGVGR